MSDFQEAHSVDSPTTKASILGLAAGQWYYFRIQASNAHGRSEYSARGELSLTKFFDCGLTIAVCPCYETWLTLAGRHRTKFAPPDRPGMPCLSKKPSATGFSLAWDTAPGNGPPIKHHTLQLWLASSLAGSPSNPAGLKPPSEASQVSEEDPCSTTAAISLTSEEAHSETGEKTRGGQGSALQTHECSEPSCSITGAILGLARLHWQCIMMQALV